MLEPLVRIEWTRERGGEWMCCVPRWSERGAPSEQRTTLNMVSTPSFGARAHQAAGLTEFAAVLEKPELLVRSWAVSGEPTVTAPATEKELERLKAEDKERKRKQQYAKKKFTKYQERSRALRDATGVHGFAALYRILGLNDRKLASEKEIRRAYKRAALRWHPDKLKEGEDPEKAAEMFDSIKAAYDLLLEGMENGTIEGHSVFSAGELANGAPH